MKEQSGLGGKKGTVSREIWARNQKREVLNIKRQRAIARNARKKERLRPALEEFAKLGEFQTSIFVPRMKQFIKNEIAQKKISANEQILMHALKKAITASINERLAKHDHLVPHQIRTAFIAELEKQTNLPKNETIAKNALENEQEKKWTHYFKKAFDVEYGIWA